MTDNIRNHNGGDTGNKENNGATTSVEKFSIESWEKWVKRTRETKTIKKSKLFDGIRKTKKFEVVEERAGTRDLIGKIWTDERCEYIKAIACRRVEDFSTNKDWSPELKKNFQFWLTLFAGVPEKKARELFGENVGEEALQAIDDDDEEALKPLWDDSEKFENDIDAILEDWDVALKRHRQTAKNNATPKDTNEFLRQKNWNAQDLSDYQVAVCVYHRRGFTQRGHLGGNPFYDLAMLRAGRERNNNNSFWYAYDSAYRDVVENLAQKLAREMSIDDRFDLTGWYEDFRDWVFNKLAKKEDDGKYRGDAGLARFLNTSCQRELAKQARNLSKEKSAAISAFTQGPLENGAEGDGCAALLEIVRNNIDGRLLNLRETTFGKPTARSYSPNQRRFAYYWHVGPPKRENVGEELSQIGALSGIVAAIPPKQKRTEEERIEEAKLEALTRRTGLTVDEIADKFAQLGESCSKADVTVLYTGLSEELLDGFLQAYKEFYASKDEAADAERSELDRHYYKNVLKKQLKAYREQAFRNIDAILNDLEECVRDENATNKKILEVLREKRLAFAELEESARLLNRRNGNLKQKEEGEKARLKSRKDELNAQSENASAEMKKALKLQLEEVDKLVATCEANAQCCDRRVNENRLALSFCEIAAAELKDADERIQKLDSNGATLDADAKRETRETLLKIRAEFNKAPWRDKISWKWRKELSKQWSKSNVGVACDISDSVAVWLECVDRIDPETGDYPRL
ncbi:MAG: hypothetical protein IJE77_05870 [Thermoguttaceae bacterium]|nr:hypothetical protein [Thermoguttaceae bacterium]MBQ9800021.1 hypothetical protein [Thermoguttaceae bacterium]